MPNKIHDWHLANPSATKQHREYSDGGSLLFQFCSSLLRGGPGCQVSSNRYPPTSFFQVSSDFWARPMQHAGSFRALSCGVGSPAVRVETTPVSTVRSLALSLSLLLAPGPIGCPPREVETPRTRTHLRTHVPGLAFGLGPLPLRVRLAAPSPGPPFPFPSRDFAHWGIIRWPRMVRSAAVAQVPKEAVASSMR